MEVAALLQTGTPRRAGLRCGKIRGPREPRPPPPRQHHLLRCIRGAKVFWGTERATQLLLAELASLCTDGGWAGRITACLASEGLGCIVKIIHPVDKNARVKQDARVVSRGRGRKDLTFDDNRWSKTYVATGPHTALRVRGTGGKEDAFVEEATITFTKHVVERRVSTQPELEALKVADVGEDTNVEGLSHFAAIVRNDGNSRPFSVHEAAPPLYTSKGKGAKRLYVAELAAYTNTCMARAAARQRAEAAVAAATVEQQRIAEAARAWAELMAKERLRCFTASDAHAARKVAYNKYTHVKKATKGPREHM
ncbi:unnamed protein product [Ascophyllum nodosum]